MVTDGVLEYLHVKDRQGKLMDIIAGVKSDNAGVMAQENSGQGCCLTQVDTPWMI